MRKDTYYELIKLRNEQLVKIIDDYHRCLCAISECCVSESKLHIKSEDAIDKIREYLSKYMRFDLDDEYLGEYIDMKLGKISDEEYMDIVLGVDD